MITSCIIGLPTTHYFLLPPLVSVHTHYSLFTKLKVKKKKQRDLV